MIFSIAVVLSFKYMHDSASHHYEKIWLSNGFIMLLVAMRTWMTPVIESMMIVEMKKDLARGAEDVETFA